MEPEKFDELFAEAEQLRIAHKAEDAIAKYQSALQSADSIEDQLAAYHMAGVTFGMAADFDGALLYLDHALRIAVAHNPKAEGNIQRDRARQLWAVQRWEEALDALIKAIRSHLTYDGPDELAATLGFYGRLICERGDLETGLLWLRAAHIMLQQGSNRYWELYNALNLAEYLLEAGYGGEAEKAANLSLRLVEGGYGDEPHRKRALATLRIAQGPH